MKEDKTQADRDTAAANAIRNRQDKIRNRFAYLQDVDHKDFSAEYVRAQAKEACKILQEVKLTPLNTLFSKLNEFMNSDDFMYDMYLRDNGYGQIEPDESRIEKLVIKVPKNED